MTEASASASVGRPRDPSVDKRILEAAVEVYGEAGWTGFSFDAVSRRSGVGKASIYLRWGSKEDLLSSALRQHGTIEQIDTGNVRDDMIEMVRQVLNTYLGDAGRAMMRLAAEAPSSESIDAVHRRWIESQVRSARALARRAIARGELNPDVSVTLLLDMLCGSAVTHAKTTLPERLDEVRRTSDEFVVRLVDFILRGVAAQPEGSGGHAVAVEAGL